MNPRSFQNSFIYLLIFVAIAAILMTVFNPSRGGEDVELSQVIALAQQGQINRIEVNGNDLKIIRTSGAVLTSRKESGQTVFEILESAGIDIASSGLSIEVKGASGLSNFFGIIVNFLPLILFGGILIFMMRQAQGGNSQALNFGRSRAKLFVGNRPTVTFEDVAGVDEAKNELEEVVEFLRYPERFQALGARVPSGVLLIGSPGGGKTLLSRAVAGEAGVPFFSISGSEFVEMFVGVGASRVRDLFEQAKKNSPSIVFIDEIDAVGRHRGAGLGGGHDEREQTLNQILVEMDGFDTNTNVIVLAATNRPDILDPALLRPGRFDRRVTVDTPDVRGRQAILDIHLKGKPLDSSVDSELVAKQTSGFTGADLANLVNEAGILAARQKKNVIGYAEFAEAVDRVIAGPERKSRVITPKEKEITAYHEAGHALVAHHLEHADPVQKITIVSRGAMGGYTRYLPEEDRTLWTRYQFTDMLAYSLGGQVAELIVFGDVSTGASNDIEKATDVARRMVTLYGMSDKLGPVTLGRREETMFLGREMGNARDYGSKVADEIDEEIRTLLGVANRTANNVLTKYRTKLDEIAQLLIEHESVEGDELDNLLGDPDYGPRQIENSQE
ncbi:MAG: ATP-dependent metallopeptidase FtsH/Yme1/Tma family protein [SAR202 cluster bacterium]|nr:ATP-dependent metallopeptidase FtsH/Yme1/Tma family protein [SAR202 cluster bacterium]